MYWRFLMLALVASALPACGVGRAITAPVRFVFHEPRSTPPANTSDVTNPGQPVAIPSPTPHLASRKSGRSTPPGAKTKSSPTSAAQFPIAKPVPGKPGLVFNPFHPNDGYIDVSGYAPGSKVKDPDSQKIFIVPKPGG
jgi:hypothetical protein